MSDAPDILDYFDDDFFSDIVIKCLHLRRDQFKINLVVVTPASGKGDNYISVLYRARVKIVKLEDNTKQTLNIIIKALLTTMEELKEFSVFRRERIMYESVIPELEQMYRDAGVEVEFGPRSYKFETEPFEIIVLEDMAARGFKMANRHEGLDMDHTRLVLTKLGQFHAASVLFRQKHGDFHKDLVRDKGIMKMMDAFKGAQQNFYDFFIEVLEKNDFGKPYAQKIKNWSEDYFNIFYEMAYPPENGLMVLNHGDLWTNNHLYCYDDNGKPTATSLIDFQISFWASPAPDLFYFLISSTNNEIKAARFDEMVGIYYQSLVDSFKILNYKQFIPTLEDLQKDMLEKSLFGAICLFQIMLVCKIDSKEEATIDMFVKTDEETKAQLHKYFNSSVYVKALEAIVPMMGDRGMLDQR